MLKGIDPRLNAEVLFVLRAMGHGDALVISDTNFPSDSVARHTVYGELLRMDNLTAGEAVEAILSVMPLDTFVDVHVNAIDLSNEGQPILALLHSNQNGPASQVVGAHWHREANDELIAHCWRCSFILRQRARHLPRDVPARLFGAVHA